MFGLFYKNIDSDGSDCVNVLIVASEKKETLENIMKDIQHCHDAFTKYYGNEFPKNCEMDALQNILRGHFQDSTMPVELSKYYELRKEKSEHIQNIIKESRKKFSSNILHYKDCVQSSKMFIEELEVV
jgi:hypothetical protein